MRATTTIALLGVLSLTQALDLDLTSQSSILAAASAIKDDILRIYNANSSGPAIPGLFPDPYYWWEAGLAFDSLINYVTRSGDDSVVSTIQDGLLFQTGPDYNYMPPNQSKSLGNDDQATWALAAMTAAEQGFPQRAGQQVSWLSLAQNVFDAQAARWDTSTCDGGLRWQIFTFNNGYNYKNSISQGSFASLAARLYRFTGNVTYSQWAQKTVDWTEHVGLISQDGEIYDGTDVLQNCSDANHIQWSMYSGLFINTGAYLVNGSSPNAALSNYGNQLLWTVLSRSLDTFVDDNVIYEVACQPNDNCNIDQLAFRAPFARALANARDLIPFSSPAYSNAEFAGTSLSELRSDINQTLRNSAIAAARQCSSGSNTTMCGSDWTMSSSDQSYGLGQDLAALEVILANLPGSRLASGNSTATVTTAGGANGTNSSSGAVPMQTTNAASGLGVSMTLIGLGALFWALI